MNKIKVLHVLNTNRFSGAENVACQIISLLNGDSRFEFAYCSIDGPIRKNIESRGIKFIGLDKMGISDLKKAIQLFKPNIIHAHDMRASFFVAAVSTNEKLIFTIHNNAPENSKLNHKTILFRLAAKKASHIFWVSKSALHDFYYFKAINSKSSVLYNVINKDSLIQKVNLDKSNYQCDVLFLGRLTPQKNPLRLLKVFRIIIDRKPSAKLFIAGTGELEQEVKEAAHKLRLDENLTFMGFMDNPYRLVQESKVMIFTSRWEGTPMSSLEAMTLGVPIVSTPTDGLMEIVVNGETGYLSDDDNEIAKKCIEIIEDPKIRDKMSKASKDRADFLMNTRLYRQEVLKAYLGS